MPTSQSVLISEYMEDGRIANCEGYIIMNRATYNKTLKQLNKKQSKFSKFVIYILYKIDDGLLILYYKTKFKPFEIMGAYIGGIGNKMNKEFNNENNI